VYFVFFKRINFVCCPPQQFINNLSGTLDLPAVLEMAESIYIQFANTPEIPDTLQDLLPSHPIAGILSRTAAVAVTAAATVPVVPVAVVTVATTAEHAEASSATQLLMRSVSSTESTEPLPGDNDSMTGYSWISLPTSTSSESEK
jgi:hypothetical protein